MIVFGCPAIALLQFIETDGLDGQDVVLSCCRIRSGG